MKCEYGCGQEAKVQLNNGKWCCEEVRQQCPAQKKKFLRSREKKVVCERCGREISKQCFKSHLSACKVKKCLNCGKLINRSQKFCSRRCGGLYNNAHSDALKECRRGPEPSGNKYVRAFSYKRRSKNVCEVCGKLTANNRFCSVDCNFLFKKEERKNRVLSGDCTYPRTIKMFMIEEYGNKCSICGLEEWMGQPIPLIIDHIDGNPYNNILENFRLVCGNCDMQLPTYKSKNKGNGRYKRRKRYKEGKSY